MKKIEILVVEDEPKLAQTISDFLRIQNYEVETALTGNKALEYFCQNKQKVDLILLDLAAGYFRIYRIERNQENIGGSGYYFVCKVGSGRPDERI